MLIDLHNLSNDNFSGNFFINTEIKVYKNTNPELFIPKIHNGLFKKTIKQITHNKRH